MKNKPQEWSANFVHLMIAKGSLTPLPDNYDKNRPWLWVAIGFSIIGGFLYGAFTK